MGPEVRRIQTDERPSDRADVVIIGGGIIGVSTAYALARRGVSVILCEKGYIAGEQSSRNWGWVRRNGRDPRELPLMMESFRVWHEFATRGLDTGFDVCGILSIAGSDADRARHEQFVEAARPFQIGSRIVTGSEIRQILPGYEGTARTALYNPTDARAEPQRAAPAIALAAREMGAEIVQNCAVRGIEREGGRVCGVVSELGYIKTGQVVVAGGAWSRLFCGNLGVDLPQLKVLASVCRTAPVPGLPETSAYLGPVAYRRRDDGGYNIAATVGLSAPIVPDTFRLAWQYVPAFLAEYKAIRPRLDNRFLTELMTPRKWALDMPTVFEKTRVLDPRPNVRLTRGMVARLEKMFPAVGPIHILQHWGGLIDVMPDVVPVIDTVPEIPGLTISTGFSGHGFGIGPGAGQLTADLATGKTPVVDPAPFRLRRFTDGTKLRVIGGF
ncbi:FAD-binding oxidoreductase [Komagataeibacter sp. FNDCF1]|uniref:NAD(P)/FAD-dependent oxidoreductase n=1 Tax=Komagataeibacter sp. FNDCF1 TaxID=2878681 RepID=UPI001E3209A0|nr:FAD-binding oxidoreductase [Komagataeibacter sp. FNDCF1]MCE2565212.1 FAD-binding oxidoreductase [Komagataeibacter sp. FNDCF1]